LPATQHPRMAALQPVLALPTAALRTLLEEGGLEAGVSTEDVSGPAEWLIDPFESAVALTYDASMGAFARRDAIVMCRRDATEAGAAAGQWRVSNPIRPSAALLLATDVTALVWLRPHMPEHTVGGPFLAVGTSTGHLLIYGRDGNVVLKQLIHKDPILQIKCRPVAQHSGSDGSSDIALRLPGLLVQIEGADICELLARERADYGVIEEQGPPYLPHRKWKLHDQTLTTDVVCCGRMPARLSEIVPHEAPPYQLLAAGKDPCLAVYAAHGHPSVFPGLGTLAAKGVAAVASLAKSFWSWDPEPEDAPAEDKPPPLERAVGVRPSDGGVLHDPTRRLERLELDPSGRLVAGTDGFGRVMLIDVAGHLPVVTRLWKGYREAQVVWVHCEEPGAATHTSLIPAALLAIYLPRRGLLEVWPASAGARVAALSVGRELRLIAASSGRLGVERGSRTEDAAQLPRQASSGLRPWFACQCLLLAADGTLSNLVVQPLDSAAAPVRLPSDAMDGGSTGPPPPSLDDQAREQVIYRDFLHHVASGDGEDVLLKAIASINGTQALLSALKAIAESQPSHARLNWKAASVAVVELEFAHKRSPSATGGRLLHALKRREDLLRAYCVLSGEASADATALAAPTETPDARNLWVGSLRSEKLWLLKYSTAGALDTHPVPHAPNVNCIAFLQCFPPVQDASSGGLVGNADAIQLVARILFKPLVDQGNETTEALESALQRVGSAIALLDLSHEELWRLFAEWFMQQPLVGRSGQEAGTLLGKVDSGSAGSKVLRYLCAIGTEGSTSAMQLCRHSSRAGHVLALAEICAAVTAQETAASDTNWGELLDDARRAWELHKLLGLVARHVTLPIEGYASTTSLTRLVATLQLRLGDVSHVERYTSPMEIDDSYLRRIEPGSPLARRAAFVSVCQAFPQHTIPCMLDMHAAVVLASQWGGAWAEYSALDSACGLLEKLGQRTVGGDALDSYQAANAQAVGAMLIWQRFCRDIICRLLGGLETGHGFPTGDAPDDPAAIPASLAIFGRLVSLFDPMHIVERKFSLGTRVDNIMERLDEALSDAPPIDGGLAAPAVGTFESDTDATQTAKTKSQAFNAFGLTGAEEAPAWPPIELADEFMGATDFSAAAARVSACERQLHAEYCILLQILAAMATYNITDLKPSALFRCQYQEDDSGSPFAPLEQSAGDEGESPRSSNQRYARERLVQKLIASNDLARGLAVASLFGQDCQRVRVQWVLRAYEMANEDHLDQEVMDAIDDRYKLGVGLLTVARQRLARVLLAAQDRAEEQAAQERQNAEDGRGDGGNSRGLIVPRHEKQENELLRLMQTKLAQKQVGARRTLFCPSLLRLCLSWPVSFVHLSVA
jgi:hypothetical protein